MAPIFRWYIIAFFTTAALSAPAWYADLTGDDAGQSVGQVLTLPVSADALARGLASSGGAMDATDLPFFVANSALFDRNEFAVSHCEWLMGLRNEYTGAAFPILDMGTFGVFSRFFTAGTFENARTIDETPSNPSFFEYNIGVSFAKSFLHKALNLGLSGSYVESDLDGTSGQAFAGNADLLVVPSDRVSGRIYVLNAGTGLTYVATAEPLPLQTGLSMQVTPLSRSNPLDSTFDFSLGAGVQKTYDEPVLFSGNAVVTLKQNLRLEAGYEHLYKTAFTAAGLSAGMGFHVNTYGFDAAWKYESPDLGSVWAATIKMQMEEIVPKTAEQYYEIALRQFEKHRFILCKHYALKALEIDPNLWKAHELLSRMNSESLRNEGLEIAIIYTGNTRGEVIPYPPVPETPGGLSRQAEVVRNLRAQFPVSVAIDVGNMITPVSEPPRAALADKYYKYINYDIVAPGEGEIGYGLKKYFTDARKSNVQFLCSNFSNPFSPDIISHRVVKSGPYQFFVAGVVGKGMVRNEESKNLTPALDELASQMLFPAARRATVRIAVIHDTWNNVKDYIPAIDGADVVICGSLDQRFEGPMKIGSSLVLSVGSGGKYVGNLILRFNSQHKLLSFDNHLIPLTSEIPPDSTIDSLVTAVSASIDLQKQGMDVQDLVKSDGEGTFAFLTDRTGSASLYLKVASKLADFPIASGKGAFSSPDLSFKAGKMSAIETDSGAKCPMLMGMDIDGASKHTLVSDMRVTASTFTPDGSWLYFTAGACGDTCTEIYKMRPGGGPLYPIIKWDSCVITTPSFSPDGNLMLFSSNREGRWHLYLSNAKGENPLRISDPDANHFSPSFSPDGWAIAYLSDRKNFGGKLDLWVYDRKTSRQIQITNNSNVKDFCWLGDSRTIVYSSGSNLLDLTSVDVEAFRFRKVVKTKEVKIFNEVHPMAVQYHKEQKIVYERDYPDGTKKIYWVNTDGTGDQCITPDKGNEWLE